MVLDGLIGSPIPFNLRDIICESENILSDLKQLLKRQIIKYFSKVFSKTFLSPYLPSIIASSNLDHIYTIGNFSNDIIKKYCNSSTTVFNTGLPRMKTYFKTKPISFKPSKPKSVCFITSAYKWHGLKSYHKYQMEDIYMIKKILSETYYNENITFDVKLHPRENKEDYIHLEKMNINIVDNINFDTVISQYNIILSNLSTCIVEGSNYGVDIISVMINFPFWKVKNGFLGINEIVKIFEESELKTIIEEKLNTTDILYNTNINNNFLSVNTPNSDIIISEHIVKLLKCKK